MGNPTAYIGQNITVRGEVKEVYSTSGFKLDEGSVLTGGIDNDLRVIASKPGLTTIDDQLMDDEVIVSGTLRIFVLAEVERDVGIDLQPEIEAQFENRPVLIADSVEMVGTTAGVFPTPGTVAPAPDADGTVTVADIVGSPAAYLNQTVTVTSDIQEILGAEGFRLDDGAATAGGIDNDLLVIGAEPGLAATNAGLVNQRVMVTGTVRMFDRAALQSELGSDLDANLFDTWANKPVLVADSIQAADAAGAVTGPADVNVSTISVADITGNPAAYAGQSVTVRGDVDNVFGPSTFTLDDGSVLTGGIDNDLLVVGATKAFALDNGWLDNKVDVKGTVRTFVLADIEREYGLDLDDTQFAAYENKPVLVADAIEQLQGR